MCLRARANDGGLSILLKMMDDIFGKQQQPYTELHSRFSKNAKKTGQNLLTVVLHDILQLAKLEQSLDRGECINIGLFQNLLNVSQICCQSVENAKLQT